MNSNTPGSSLKKISYDGVVFIGSVINNNDPEMLERVKIRIPEIHDEVEDTQLPWAIPFTQIPGHFSVPSLNSKVYVKFQQGLPSFPIYFGRTLDKNSIYTESTTNYPNRVGWVDALNNYFYSDSIEGSIKLHHNTGTEVSIDKDGNILVGSVKNISMTVIGDTSISTSGKTDITSTGDVNVTSNGNVTIKGTAITLGTTVKKLVVETFLSMFDTHTHTGNLGAPTSPPMIPQSSSPSNVTSITKGQ